MKCIYFLCFEKFVATASQPKVKSPDLLAGNYVGL